MGWVEAADLIHRSQEARPMHSIYPPLDLLSGGLKKFNYCF